MTEHWEPNWWQSLNPDFTKEYSSEFGKLQRVLEHVSRDASQLEKSNLNRLLGWVSEPGRRNRGLAVLHAAEVCQELGDADVTTICLTLTIRHDDGNIKRRT